MLVLFCFVDTQYSKNKMNCEHTITNALGQELAKEREVEQVVGIDRRVGTGTIEPTHTLEKGILRVYKLLSQ